jgi:hypothetical protein
MSYLISWSPSLNPMPDHITRLAVLNRLPPVFIFTEQTRIIAWIYFVQVRDEMSG